MDNVERLQGWIQTTREWNEAVKIISKDVDKQLEEYQSITDEDLAASAMVDLLFMCNRFKRFVEVWFGIETEEED